VIEVSRLDARHRHGGGHPRAAEVDPDGAVDRMHPE
jgi:hypothetical protein